MLRSMIDSTTIPVLQEMIHFAQSRHSVLAGNIANMNVPGYELRDLSVESFQSRMEEALKAKHEQKAPPSPGVLEKTPDPSLRDVRESLKTVRYHDGTNVGIEQQVAEMSKNQMMHNLSISVMNAQYRILNAAVSERV